jgi:putative hydrolase of the HAD superfamily
VAIEMVFFDAGETLLRPYPSFAELFVATARDHGVEIRVDDVNAVRARIAPTLLELAEDSGVDQPSLLPERSYDFWGYVYRRFLLELGTEDEALVKRLFTVFSDSASYKLYDDSLPTLIELQERGYRLGLISNFEGWLEKLLIELEVGHLFDTTVISAVEGLEKPDPAIYELALERAGTEAARSAMVGDSPSNDVEPSARVGMVPVLLDRSGHHGAMNGCEKVSSLEDLPDLLAKL